MKKNLFMPLLFVLILVATLESCKKDDKYTIENQPVTGTMNYTTTAMVPIEFDPQGNPVTFQISMEGSGTLSNLGEIHMTTTFKFNFAGFNGYDFVTTYTSANASDSFSTSGSSKLDQTMTGDLVEVVSDGKGKFENIIGGGVTVITIFPDQSGGTGDVSWNITY
jgi:hypothetical protein